MPWIKTHEHFGQMRLVGGDLPALEDRLKRHHVVNLEAPLERIARSDHLVRLLGSRHRRRRKRELTKRDTLHAQSQQVTAPISLTEL